MSRQEIEKAINEINRYKHDDLLCTISDDACNTAIQCMQQQFNNEWILCRDKLPEPKQWCWIWFDYDDGSGEGFCEKMVLNSNGKWMRNAITIVKDEYAECIKAWQPYYEPNPYKQ